MSSQIAPEARAKHVVDNLIIQMAVEMGWINHSNPKPYADLLYDELHIEIWMLHHALVQFYARHPFDAHLSSANEPSKAP